MKTNIIAVLVFALVAISSAQICPTVVNDLYRADFSVNVEYFAFPSFYHGNWPFDVTSNSNSNYKLHFTENNLRMFSYIGSNGDFQIAAFCDVTLINTQYGWSKEIRAFGTFSPFGLRTVPDFKWVTLYDIELCGTLDNHPVNVSISYADFWSDSPADDIWSTKSVTRSPYLGCRHEHLEAGGCNYVQSKGFWLELELHNNLRLNFYVPANIPGFIYKNTILEFWDHCTCNLEA